MIWVAIWGRLVYDSFYRNVDCQALQVVERGVEEFRIVSASKIGCAYLLVDIGSWVIQFENTKYLPSVVLEDIQRQLFKFLFYVLKKEEMRNCDFNWNFLNLPWFLYLLTYSFPSLLIIFINREKK